MINDSFSKNYFSDFGCSKDVITKNLFFGRNRGFGKNSRKHYLSTSADKYEEGFKDSRIQEFKNSKNSRIQRTPSYL